MTPAFAALLLVRIFTAVLPIHAADPSSGLPDLLRRQIGATPAQLQQVRQGSVFAKLLPEIAKDEIGVAGIMHVDVPIDFVLNDIEQIEAFKKSPAILQLRKFHQPPQEQDLQSLTLPAGDVSSMPTCVPGNCAIKLSTDMMDQIESQLRSPDAKGAGAVESAFRTVLFQYLDQYQERGIGALITYRDKSQPVRLADTSAAIVQQFSWIRSFSPVLWTTLERQSPLKSGGDDLPGFYYWSKEKVALKPVVSLTQTLVWRSRDILPDMAFVASRQLYASHYFEASLGLAIIVNDSSSATPAVWIIYLNRSRVDAFDGWMGSLKRSLVNSKITPALRQNLIETRAKIENRYSAANTTK
jgi:hypothetical protein